MGNVKATVAILGGTGNLGYYISKIFLTDRDASSAKAQELAKLGAEIYLFDDAMYTFLAGVDLVVTPSPARLLREFKAGLLHALVRNGVKVYFPSEFGGYDITQNLFPGYEYPEWIKKGALALETHAILDGKVKIIRLDTGGFLTWLVGPGRVFNWDTEKNVYTIIGPSTAKNTLTHQADIGRSVAQVSVLALDPATTATVPGHIHVTGNVVDFEELREIVSRVKGIPKGEIVCQDVVVAKEALKKDPTPSVMEYVKIFGAEGAMDFSKNDNELVNPGQSLWKWKTVEEEFRGGHGRSPD